jgi:hypothetical protein
LQAERATVLANGMAAGQHQSVTLGTMLGLSLELSIDRGAF